MCVINTFPMWCHDVCFHCGVMTHVSNMYQDANFTVFFFNMVHKIISKSTSMFKIWYHNGVMNIRFFGTVNAIFLWIVFANKIVSQ